MKTKLKIPKGYVVDLENSTPTEIKLKRVLSWIENTDILIDGFYPDPSTGEILQGTAVNTDNNCIYPTEALAKSAQALARLTQIMYYDPRFKSESTEISKYFSIDKYQEDRVIIRSTNYRENVLCFDSRPKAHLFLKEFKDLVYTYLMVENN